MNVLAGEKSPYLQQHAHQPVHWQPWSKDVLKRAKREDKPLLLSVGFSSCHWCHVMSEESFEDDEVAAYMNEHFINVKVDREEYPDLDTYYMAACEAVSGKGGWPLNVFLLPSGEAYFAGTYFPPQAGLRQRSWMQALQLAAYNFYENRDAVINEARRIREKMKNKEKTAPLVDEGGFWSLEKVQDCYHRLKHHFDQDYGGFGTDKKFPNIPVLEFLLDYAWHTSSLDAMRQVECTVGRMLQGGLMDQLGGGFFRYTVDRHWRIPHFEKMLYDTALIAGLLAKLYKWRRKPIYLEALERAIGFILRGLKRAEGGFYASLDAAVAGLEGGAYTWTVQEVKELLGTDHQWFCEYYNMSVNGNWQGCNVLYTDEDISSFARRKGVSAGAVRAYLHTAKVKLLEARLKRKQPEKDQKINLSWNALMLSAFIESFETTNNGDYLVEARSLKAFLEEEFVDEEGGLRHLLDSKKLVYLEDYAYYIDALLRMQSATQEHTLLEEAERYTKQALGRFEKPESSLLAFAPSGQSGLPYDWPIAKDEELPNANAIMAANLQRLGLMLGRRDWTERAGLCCSK